MTDPRDEYGPVLAEPIPATSHVNVTIVQAPPAPTRRKRIKSMVLVLSNRPDRRKYERMVRRGWTVESTTARTLSRAVTVVFSR